MLAPALGQRATITASLPSYHPQRQCREAGVVGDEHHEAPDVGVVARLRVLRDVNRRSGRHPTAPRRSPVGEGVGEVELCHDEQLEVTDVLGERVIT